MFLSSEILIFIPEIQLKYATLSCICGTFFLPVEKVFCVVQKGDITMSAVLSVISLTGVHGSLVVAAPRSVGLPVAGCSKSDSITQMFPMTYPLWLTGLKVPTN